MSEPMRSTQAERNETPSERADRNFAELVQELRIAQTGVQILFAFLLTIAFAGSFPRDDEVYAYVLTAALVVAAGSAVCFMAPVATHRAMFRLGGKERIVWVTHTFAMSGLALLAVAMLLAIWMVIAFLFSYGAANALVAVLGALILLIWLVLPLRWRGIEAQRERRERN
jgi:hypothetical protein